MAERMVVQKVDHWVASLDALTVARMAADSAEKKAVHLVWKTAARWVVEMVSNLVATTVEMTAQHSVDAKAVRMALWKAARLVAPMVADSGATKVATMVG